MEISRAHLAPARHSFTLRPELSETSRARRLVMQVAAEAGFSEERCFDIQVASSEACANAIEHSPPDSDVELEVLVHQDRLEVMVEGRGEFELPAVAAREQVHRGLGLPLMAKLSDHLAFYAGPRGGTLVALTFYRPDARGARVDGGEAFGTVSAVRDTGETRRAERSSRTQAETVAGLLTAAGRLRVFERQRAWLVFLVGAAVQAGLMIGVGHLGSPRQYLGIPGAAAALIGVVAAIMAGPFIGIAVALVGGAVYFVFITDLGNSVDWPAIVISIVLWTLAGAVAGLAGDWVRRNAAHREKVLAGMLAEREGLMDQLHIRTKALATQHDELQKAHTDTAGLLEQQRSLFRRLQDCLVDIPPQLPGVAFSHLYRSATEQTQVGGDFYDIFEAKGGNIALLVGDVSGHGLEAARAATLVKDTMRAFAHQFRRPHLVLRETNRLLVEKNLPGFVSAFLGFLDPATGSITYSMAGHPPPLLAQDGHVARLESHGLPLGVFPDAHYHDTRTDIPEGSLLLLYTDGITEARWGADFFGEARLAEALAALRSGPVDSLPSDLLGEALEFSHGVLRDDVALLAINYVGTGRGEQSRPVSEG